MKRPSLRFGLGVLVATTIFLILVVISILQIYWTNTLVIDKVQDRVKQHINSAWQTLEDNSAELSTISYFLAEMLISGVQPVDDLQQLLTQQRQKWHLDLLCVQDNSGKTVAGSEKMVAEYIISTISPEQGSLGFTGIVLVPAQFMDDEFKSPNFYDMTGATSADGLFLIAGRPLKNSSGEAAGIVLSGKLLNDATMLIDTIQGNLFKNEFYKGNRVGTVTIFAGPFRVATSVLLENGKRAIGTRVSPEVEHQVLLKGEPWTGRAKVVDAWYLSRYEPIRDLANKVVGMLYIGELEQIYIDQKYITLIIGIGAVLSIIVLACMAGIFMVRQTERIEQEKKKARFHFISVLGHELKAPLNAVDGYLDIMDGEKAGSLNDDYKVMVNRSMVRIGYMRKLIADLLDLTRIESEQKPRELENIDVTKIASESIDMLIVSAQERGITIEIDAGQPVNIVADRDEMTMIFNNLISNAVKYNRYGGQVFVTVNKEDSRVKISVRDTGIGMTEEEMRKLFHEFQRIKNPKTRNILGSGLGLSIVKKISEMYHGEVFVQSEPDVGSTFTVVLK